MEIKLGVLMDPLESIKTDKDSSFAMLLAAQSRGWRIYYLQQNDLLLTNNTCLAHCKEIRVADDPNGWFEIIDQQTMPLQQLDVVLMRKDPPFDMEYIYTTYLLEQAETAGTLVVNRPSSLRDANEKLFTTMFPQCAPPTLVTREAREIQKFLHIQGDIIIKPLDGMGGDSVFRVGQGEPNFSVIVETMTKHGERFVMAQRFIPEISAGDKRILMIDGEPVPYALARIPASGETRGNLAAGGKGEGVALSERDLWIAAQVGTELKKRGILFAGLDVIGDYLTEINITSPTCIRELDRLFGLDIAADLMDAITTKLAK